MVGWFEVWAQHLELGIRGGLLLEYRERVKQRGRFQQP